MQVPELLLKILYQLPPMFLITTCRLVCRQWKILIETDRGLRYITWTSSENHPPPCLWDRCRRRLYAELDEMDENSNGNVNKEMVKADMFEINPVAIHFLQLGWKRYITEQLQLTEKESSENKGDIKVFDFVVDKIRLFHTLHGRNEDSHSGLERANKAVLPTWQLVRPFCHEISVTVCVGWSNDDCYASEAIVSFTGREKVKAFPRVSVGLPLMTLAKACQWGHLPSKWNNTIRAASASRSISKKRIDGVYGISIEVKYRNHKNFADTSRVSKTKLKSLVSKNDFAIQNTLFDINFPKEEPFDIFDVRRINHDVQLQWRFIDVSPSIGKIQI